MIGIDQAIPPDALPVEMQGTTYLFTTLRLRDHADGAAEMRKSFVSQDTFLPSLLRGLTQSQADSLLKVAYYDARNGHMVRLDDLFAWYETPAGKLFNYWLRLRRHHPELTIDKVDELLQAVEEVQREAIATTDGGPPGNSSMPSSETATTKAEV